MTEKAPLWEPFYPASFSTPCVTSVFRRKPLFRTGHRTRQIWLICEWDLGLAWLANLQKSCLSKRPAKAAQWGLVWGSGVVSLLRRRKPHTSPHSWDSGVIWLCRQSIFRVSSFSSPFPKVLFFVYAAQFLHRTILPSSTLITFCRTLLEYYESLFVFCTAIECAFSNRLKTGPNRRCYEFGYCFSTSTRKASHRSTQAVTQGVPAWLSYLMLSSSVHPEIFSPSAAGGIAPPLPGLGGW